MASRAASQRPVRTGDLGAGGPGPQPTVGQVGTVLFLASDLMLFAALFTAYFVLRAGATGPWPPTDVELETVPATIFTILLVASSGTLQFGIHAMEERGDRRTLQRWTVVTIVLGVLFVANQVREYAAADFGISSHAYGSVYVGLTSVHLAHVVVGLGLLAAQWWRARHDELMTAGDVAAAGYVWHLVDVVWVAVYITLYVLR